ncbi:MAG: carbonic anhydrase [Bryobacterales bacterium]
MQEIIDGVRKFQREVFPEMSGDFKSLASGQSPSSLVITCSDSRVVPSLITQTEPGEIFIIRNAGNIVPSHGEMVGGVSATIEYAVMVLNVREIIVCGHSDCGALKGVLHPESVSELPAVRAWLRYADRARMVVEENYDCRDESEKLWALIQENTLAQLDHLMTHPCVASRVRKGQLRLHGWVYHIDSGEVTVYDRDAKVFRPFREVYEHERAVSTT